MGVILSLDLGTTGNRVIAFDVEGRCVAHSYYTFSQNFPCPGWVEQDPIQIWETALRAFQDVLREIEGQPVLGLGVTNQRETTVIWDRRTGEPIYPAIGWQCRRTAQYCESLSMHKEIVRAKTGLFLDPYFSATKIRWILDHVDQARENAALGHLAFGTIDTWILWQLTKGAVHATDPSNASRTMLFNIETLEWDKDLLELFNIPESLLPSVFPSDHSFGMVDSDFSPVKCLIKGVLGDQQAALFAHQVEGRAAIKNTYGTGLFMVAHVPGQRPQSSSLLSTIAWQRNGAVDYALEGSMFMGGAVLQWLRDKLNVLKATEDSAKMAMALSSNEGVYFVPALSGLGAPHWDPDARGLLIGLTQGTCSEHLVRASLESLAYQTCDVYQAMCEALPQYKFLQLGVDGGATENVFLMQFQADVLQMDVSVPMITDITAFGIAGLVGCALGQWTLSQFLTLKSEKSRYSPQVSQIEVELKLKGWREAVQRSRGWQKYV